MFLWGLTAVVLTGVLGGVGLATGVVPEYRPPALTSADLVGRWSDGGGGTLTFTADGRATTDSINGGDGEPDACTGQGTWTYAPCGSTRPQEVDTAVDPDCGYLYRLTSASGGL